MTTGRTQGESGLPAAGKEKAAQDPAGETGRPSRYLWWGLASLLFTLWAAAAILANLRALERQRIGEYRRLSQQISEALTQYVLRGEYQSSLNLIDLVMKSSSLEFIGFYLQGREAVTFGKKPALADPEIQDVIGSGRVKRMAHRLLYGLAKDKFQLLFVFSLEDFYGRQRNILEAMAVIVSLLAALLVAFYLLDRTRMQVEAKNRAWQRAQERLVESENVRSLMIHSIAHNLNNALNIIAAKITGLQLKRENGRPLDSLDKDLALISEENKTIGYMIGNLSEHDSLRRGEVKVAPAREDLVPLIHRAVKNFAESLELKKMRIRADLPQEAWVVADGRVVAQVLMNLVGNAVKYSPPESAIGIWLETGGGLMAACIKDQGPGIREEDWERIFEPFVRLHKDRARGTGLGLSNSRRLIRQLGGNLAVRESRVGFGSTFYFTLPAPVAGIREPEEKA